MKRRTLLAVAGVVPASLAGCFGEIPSDAVVTAVQESPPEHAPVVSYDDLPRAEQRIARTAVEEDRYHACPEVPAAVRSFGDRFTEHEDSYLTYHETGYAMYIRIADATWADSAPAPENEPSCGLI